MIARALAIAGVALVCACGGGSASSTPAPTKTPTTTPARSPTASPTPDVLAVAALLEGRYTGTWNNTTFGSSGPITVDIKLDRTAGTVSVTLTLGGNVFGAAPPPTETFTIKPDPTQSSFMGKSATFGDLSATFALTGLAARITAKGTNVPSPRVSTFDAAATVTDPRTLSGTYTVGFRDGTAPAQGTFTLTKAA